MTTSLMIHLPVFILTPSTAQHTQYKLSEHTDHCPSHIIML